MKPSNVDVVFSDLDGTLLHYPKHFLEYAEIISEQPASTDAPETVTIKYKENNEICECVALTSMTGGKAYISRKTNRLIQQLRELGVIFVIITGARSSTYGARRPLLPAADYEFFENGGRKLCNGVLDSAWTARFEAQIGVIEDSQNLLPSLPPPKERTGSLWGLYEELLADGWQIDIRNYVANFRVDVANSAGKTDTKFREVVERECEKRGLTSSFNLGKADIYPAASGKANAARHILELNHIDATNAVALFDDDNDLELGALCGASFLPSVTHPNVLEAIKEHPEWTLMKRKGFLGTEDAIENIIQMRMAVQTEQKHISVLS